MSNAPESRHDFETDSAYSVYQLTQRNVEAIRELEEPPTRSAPRSDRVAEAIANFCGCMTFVWVHVVWFGIWILINVIPLLRHIDPFPFGSNDLYEAKAASCRRSFRTRHGDSR